MHLQRREGGRTALANEQVARAKFYGVLDRALYSSTPVEVMQAHLKSVLKEPAFTRQAVRIALVRKHLSLVSELLESERRVRKSSSRRIVELGNIHTWYKSELGKLES